MGMARDKTQVFHVWPEEPIKTDQDITLSARLESPGYLDVTLFFKFSHDQEHNLTELADPFVVASIFAAMNTKRKLVVHGKVSPGLIENLNQFQETWVAWQPKHYTTVDVKADGEKLIRNKNRRAIMTMGGGLDSTFTFIRHKPDVVFIEGWSNAVGSQKTAVKVKKLVNLANGPRFILCENNLRNSVPPYRFNDMHGTILAATLSCFAKGYKTGFIGASFSYWYTPKTDDLGWIVWGTNPITDPLLGSDNFKLVHDGCPFTRTDKVGLIAKEFPEAIEHLQFCTEGTIRGRNCGVCTKCVRTVLNLHLNGVDVPDSFETKPELLAFYRFPRLERVDIFFMSEILEDTRRRGIRENWVTLLEDALLEWIAPFSRHSIEVTPRRDIRFII